MFRTLFVLDECSYNVDRKNYFNNVLGTCLDAAAAPGPKNGAFLSFNVVCSSPNSVNLPLIHKQITTKHIYDCKSL